MYFDGSFFKNDKLCFLVKKMKHLTRWKIDDFLRKKHLRSAYIKITNEYVYVVDMKFTEVLYVIELSQEIIKNNMYFDKYDVYYICGAGNVCNKMHNDALKKHIEKVIEPYYCNFSWDKHEYWDD